MKQKISGARYSISSEDQFYFAGVAEVADARDLKSKKDD